MADVKENRADLGTLLERVLRRLHDKWHAEMDDRDEDHESIESDAERTKEAARAQTLLRVLYPDMDVSVEHKPAEDFKEAKDGDKEKDEEE